jgi:hypothetical protein
MIKSSFFFEPFKIEHVPIAQLLLDSVKAMVNYLE